MKIRKYVISAFKDQHKAIFTQNEHVLHLFFSFLYEQNNHF